MNIFPNIGNNTINRYGGVTMANKDKNFKNDKKNNNKNSTKTQKSNNQQDTNTFEGK